MFRMAWIGSLFRALGLRIRACHTTVDATNWISKDDPLIKSVINLKSRPITILRGL